MVILEQAINRAGVIGFATTIGVGVTRVAIFGDRRVFWRQRDHSFGEPEFFILLSNLLDLVFHS